MSYKIPITGGCLCGQVRYSISAEPVGSGNCHCKSCQKAVGAGYLAVLFVPANALDIIGSYKEFPTIAASGNKVYRGFCPECGTTLFGETLPTKKYAPSLPLRLIIQLFSNPK